MNLRAGSARWRSGAACIALLAVSFGVGAQVEQDIRACGPAPHGAWCADGPWSKFASMDFMVSAGNFKADYVVRVPAGGDLYARYDEKRGGKRRKGEILVVGDRAIAFLTGDERDESREIDTQMLSAPLMLSQLVSVLLQTGAPGGEKTFAQTRQVSVQETTRFVLTGVPGAAALYGPPWSVTGTVRRAAPGKVDFSLRFRFTLVDATGAIVPGKTETIALSGTATYPAKREGFPDSFSLAGWQLQQNGADLPEMPTLGAMRQFLRGQ
jgi:hypothetical protein